MRQAPPACALPPPVQAVIQHSVPVARSGHDLKHDFAWHGVVHPLGNATGLSSASKPVGGRLGISHDRS